MMDGWMDAKMVQNTTKIFHYSHVDLSYWHNTKTNNSPHRITKQHSSYLTSHPARTPSSVGLAEHEAGDHAARMASEREAGRGQRQLVPERGAEVRHELRSGPVAGSNDQEAARA